MAGDGLRADDLQTVELDELLAGSASSALPARLSAHATWLLAIGMMAVAGALSWVAALTPWAWGRFAPFYGSTEAFISTLPNPALLALIRLIWAHGGFAPAITVIFTCVQLYAALGLFIGGALLASSRPGIRRALLLIYGVWLATTLGQVMLYSALLTADAQALLSLMNPSGEGFSNMRLLDVTPGAGLWLAWLAALLGVVGAISARRALRQDGALLDVFRAPDRRRVAWASRGRLERWGAGLATAGILLWICGFFTLPWVTQGCAGLHFSLTHFVSGSCAGLDAADALTRSTLFQPFAASAVNAPGAWLPISAPISQAAIGLSDTAQSLASVGFVYVLLAGLACWALLQLWSGPDGARRCGWGLAWLALACLVAAFAFQGSGVALENPVTLDISITSSWVFGPGLMVTLAGLAVGGCGLACALAGGALHHD